MVEKEAVIHMANELKQEMQKLHDAVEKHISEAPRPPKPPKPQEISEHIVTTVENLEADGILLNHREMTVDEMLIAEETAGRAKK